MIADRSDDKRLYRTLKNRNITGVCAGIAKYTNVDVSIIRLTFIVFLVFNITTLLIYIFATAIIPADPEDQEEEQHSDDQDINVKLYVISMILIFIGLLIIAKYLDIPFFFNLWNIPILLSLGIMILFFGLVLISLLRYLKRLEGDSLSINKIKSQQMISGVLAGLALKIRVDVTIVRLTIVTFCLLFFQTIPLAAILYSLAAINLEYED